MMAGREDEDPELRELISRLLDGALDEEERKRLEYRLTNDPDARAYCVRNLRFDALMQEALGAGALEFEEIRRARFDPRDPAKTIVQRLQTIRWRRGGGERHPRRRWLLLLPVAGVVAGALLLLHEFRAASWSLRNGDFEAMDLTRSPTGVGASILDWQDYFRSGRASLCEIGRVSDGRIFARSGRNVARLEGRGFLTQRLLDRSGTPLFARAGVTVVLEGWAYCEGQPPFELRGSLRFVASAYPEMIQYEAAFATVVLRPGGWHPFEVRLELPRDLVVPPSDVYLNSSSTIVRKHERTILPGEPPPAIDLEGKPLTLSIDQDAADAVVYLDDLRIEVIESR